MIFERIDMVFNELFWTVFNELFWTVFNELFWTVIGLFLKL